jgi:hypothetical protein
MKIYYFLNGLALPTLRILDWTRVRLDRLADRAVIL